MGQVESQPTEAEAPQRKGDAPCGLMCSFWTDGDPLRPRIADAAAGGVTGGSQHSQRGRRSLQSRQGTVETDTLLRRNGTPASDLPVSATNSLAARLKAQLQDRPLRDDRWEQAKLQWERQVEAQLAQREASECVAAKEALDSKQGGADSQDDERRRALELIRLELADAETPSGTLVSAEVDVLHDADAEELLPSVMPSGVLRRPSGGKPVKASSAKPVDVHALDEVYAEGQQALCETPKDSCDAMTLRMSQELVDDAALAKREI